MKLAEDEGGEAEHFSSPFGLFLYMPSENLSSSSNDILQDPIGPRQSEAAVTFSVQVHY